MNYKRRNTKKKAFSLVEVMAVVIILGLLAGVALVNFAGQVEKAKKKSTEANLKALHNAVLQFKMDTGEYPTEEDGLWALVEEPMDVTGWQQGGYLETTEVPLDAWKNEFIYILGPESGKPFVIISYGADGEPEGEDLDADLYSTDILY